MGPIADVMMFAVGCAHVYFAPYTKVEESFNLHAIHDILMYGVDKEAILKVSAFSISKLCGALTSCSMITLFSLEPFLGRSLGVYS